ncbi:DUF3488 and transglutaminase-like domain-containing protein [Microbacterium sp. zg.Y1084]|uniref:transglutaminase family protein n=1 Tax=Microbacterium sp. zg.Y1084 TaxID=2969667 RepID=UPI00214B9AC2|nr:DUF3488 and transglutaminase-like domain-containing protein [Microbacterium sp. zg.Y1084]MCR2812733.1 DUF3488 and transglutaminase-like domain-containing protein [Microbacterium sp. zg.Y1084]
MSSPDVTRRVHRRADLRLTVAVLGVVVAAIAPLVRVIEPGPGLLGAVLLATALLAAGYLARTRRVPAVAVTGLQAGLWALALTAVFFSDTALLGVIPTPETVREVPVVVSAGMNEIFVGAAPLDAGRALTFLLIAAAGLLTVVLDHVVVTARLPLLAAVGVVAVWLVPAIAVPRGVDLAAFALLAVTLLFLLRAETRTREVPAARAAPGRMQTPPQPAGVGATALGIGAIAVVVALTVTPLLPTPAPRSTAAGIGPANTIDPSLNLGSDLRQPASEPVLNVRTNAPVPPYLRVTTLSSFDGEQWQPDRIGALPFEDGTEIDEIEVDPALRVTAYRTTIEVTNLASAWLPVSFPAVEVAGLEGEWQWMPYNRTVVSQTTSSQGQSYEVVTHLPRPTREQIRATEAGGTALRDATSVLPDDQPLDVITRTAQEVTAGAENDYDRLIALQSWFRGPDFTYSLRAPVRYGFDGSGIDAIEGFLAERGGYCVHFASAFAVMARTLGMPSRIVVGYLPGTGNGRIIEGQTEYQVNSDQLHAWPEVHFDGIGWVPFEPTKSLGTPTSFLPERVGTPEDGGEDITEGLEPTAAPARPVEPINPDLAPDAADPGASGAATPQGLSLIVVLTLLGLLVLLSIPAVAREVRRRRRLAAAAGGDAAAAWLSVREAAVDLGIAVPASESPRAFGARLVAEHDAPEDAMDVLVAAIERQAYAPAASAVVSGGRGDAAGGADGRGLAAAAASVHSALARSAARRRRALAVVAPRSLIVRPGSTYATDRVTT